MAKRKKKKEKRSISHTGQLVGGAHLCRSTGPHMFMFVLRQVESWTRRSTHRSGPLCDGALRTRKPYGNCVFGDTCRVVELSFQNVSFGNHAQHKQCTVVAHVPPPENSVGGRGWRPDEQLLTPPLPRFNVLRVVVALKERARRSPFYNRIHPHDRPTPRPGSQDKKIKMNPTLYVDVLAKPNRLSDRVTRRRDNTQAIVMYALHVSGPIFLRRSW